MNFEQKDINRFNKSYNKISSGCWEWNLYINPDGYGMIKVRNCNPKSMRAHRLSYLMFKGDIPKGMVVMHLCDNRKCVNPNHLNIGTPKDNNIDMHNKKRWCDRNGENHPMCKLNNDQVKHILNLYKLGKRQIDIANLFNVTQSNINKIVNGVSRKVC